MAAIPPPPTGTAAKPPAPPPGKPLQKPPGYRDPSAPPPRRNPGAPVPAHLNRNAKPQYYRGRNNSRPSPPRRRCCCCCCALALLLLLVLAVALAAGLAYLVLQPRAPSFRIQTLRVPLLNVSVRSDETILDANASAAVLTSNPNAKLQLIYKDGHIRIYAQDDDGDVAIGDAHPFRGFAQLPGNSTVLRATATVNAAVVADAVGTRLRSRYRNGDLRFVVELRTRVAVNNVDVPLKVTCGGLTLKQLTTGGARSDAGGNKCSINLLRWINL